MNITLGNIHFRHKEDVKLKSISGMKLRYALRKIEDVVRHSNLKEQCNFYNEELKEYGIELMYIAP